VGLPRRPARSRFAPAVRQSLITETDFVFTATASTRQVLARQGAATMCTASANIGDQRSSDPGIVMANPNPNSSIASNRKRPHRVLDGCQGAATRAWTFHDMHRIDQHRRHQRSTFFGPGHRNGEPNPNSSTASDRKRLHRILDVLGRVQPSIKAASPRPGRSNRKLRPRPFLISVADENCQ
jgi:hypothetical protein